MRVSRDEIETACKFLNLAITAIEEAMGAIICTWTEVLA